MLHIYTASLVTSVLSLALTCDELVHTLFFSEIGNLVVSYQERCEGLFCTALMSLISNAHFCFEMKLSLSSDGRLLNSRGKVGWYNIR